jgi:arsenate reductase-like glutaredoxin family protein
VRELGLPVEERNFAKDKLTRAELEGIVAAAGGTAGLVNTRHAIAKERGWKDKPPTKAAFIEAALAEPNVMRRPVLLYRGKVIIGHDVDALSSLA